MLSTSLGGKRRFPAGKKKKTLLWLPILADQLSAITLVLHLIKVIFTIWDLQVAAMHNS